MDNAWAVVKVVFDRVRELDPENAYKIMGLLFIHKNSDKELIRLAFGPEHLLHTFVTTMRAALTAKPASPPSPMLGQLQSRTPCGLSSPAEGCHQSHFAAEQVDYASGDAFHPEDEYEYDYDYLSPASGRHRRGFSPSDAEVAAWRPCMYFARGYCKNGSSCRFLHDLPDDDAAPQQQLMASSFPFSPSPPRGVSLNFLLQHQQQNHPQRLAVRSPRMDRGDLVGSPAAARQIYLTFPADSTFSEEDVANYFSMYGPVQDVRIPYQQKRMFGFVAFVYAYTVKIILAEGNPHFVRNARVLVKPYKEKARVPDRKLQHRHHGDFAGCMSPTGILDSRDPFDLQQHQIGPRVMYGNIANHEEFLRRKQEEQQQAAEMEQAIQMEERRFRELQLLDLKNRGYHLGSPIASPISLGLADGKSSINAVHLEDDVTIQDKMSSTSLAMSAPAAADISATDAEGKRKEQLEEDGDGSPKQVVNPVEEEKRESGPVMAIPNVACGLQESDIVEHILPESPFASPTKASIDNINNNSPYHVASYLFPPTSTLELPLYDSSFF